MTDETYRRYRLQLPAARYEEAVALLCDLPVGGWEEDIDLSAVGSIVDPRLGWATTEEPEGDPTEGADRVVTFWLAPGAGLGGASAEALERLAALGDLSVTDQEPGWEVRWREFHQPVTVAGITVRAPWHERPPEGIDLVIDPGMAFGTGGHATTRQCLAALAALERGSLLDIGAGSGVLALAGVLLGYAPVCAVELDRDAVERARANATLNGLAIEVLEADCCDPGFVLPAADVVVANVALGPIVTLGERYAAALARGEAVPRAFVLAGLLEEQVAAAEAAFGGYRRRGIDADGAWAALILEPGA